MKKIIALALVLITLMTVTMAAFASTGSTAKITGMADSLSLGYSGSTDLGEIAPSDDHVEKISLLDTMFTWDGYDPDPATPTQLTAAQIRAARLEVRATGGSKAVKDVKINSREGCIELSFIGELVSTKEIDFDVDVVLSVDGRRQNDYALTFTGTLANPVLEVYSGESLVDISDGVVIEAVEFNSKVELELGNGVSLIAKLFKGKKYYAIVSMEPVNGSYPRDAYSEVSEKLTLRTVGFGSSDKVKLDSRYAGSYVYDEDMNYLGKSSDELPLRSVYYLSNNKLDIVKETPSESSKSGSRKPSQAEPTQPVVSSPPNVNHNPGTGR